MTTIIQVFILISLSAACSGLNVALMSLSLSELKRKAALGDSDAQRALPLRMNNHLTLASILLSNIGVISATSLVLEGRFNGLIAGVVSTLLIVLFGEVMPQAYFARNALAVFARFAPLLKILILVTYPVSKPLQLLLDRLFGKELPQLYSRGELSMMIGEHAHYHESELDEDEVEIIKGALQLSEKRVREIMTPINKVYWLPSSARIDARIIDEIKEKAWSRIPILEPGQSEATGLLLMKDLVDENFDDDPRPVSALKLHPLHRVGGMTALDTLFRKFIKARSHLMAVDYNGKIVGIVTIEDLIEEILGHEIEDESH